jgi:hypothetical protein
MIKKALSSVKAPVPIILDFPDIVDAARCGPAVA